MSKVVKIALIFSCIIVLSNCFKVFASEPSNDNICKPYIETIQRLIYPTLLKKVQEQYGPNSWIDIYDTKILNISKTSDGNMELKVQAMPYTGPHNTVAKNNITFLLTPDGISITAFISVD